MPRLPRRLLLQAYHTSPLLPLILRGSRTLQSAQNELRWLRDHVIAESEHQDDLTIRSQKLLQLCRRRERGEPLQYILGSQPFGDLDIECRPKVLIPRPETEAYTSYLAKVILEGPLIIDSNINDVHDGPLRILDLCSGTGCIALLLQSLLSAKFARLHIQGWDISKNAVSLAQKNLQRNFAADHIRASNGIRTEFHIVDLFDDIELLKSRLVAAGEGSACDIIISNPPYISQEAFNKETTRSVRNWEPRLALVPKISTLDSQFAVEDTFYHRLMILHECFGSKVLVMEVGDDAQALRVASMAFALGMVRDKDIIQIWRDAPDLSPDAGDAASVDVQGKRLHVIGAGKLRAVVLFRQFSKSLVGSENLQG